MFVLWDQEIDSWFMNHEPVIPTLQYKQMEDQIEKNK